MDTISSSAANSSDKDASGYRFIAQINEHFKRADFYYAYSFVYGYTDELLTNTLPETLFHTLYGTVPYTVPTCRYSTVHQIQLYPTRANANFMIDIHGSNYKIKIP